MRIFLIGCDPLFDRAQLYATGPYGYDDGFVRFPLFVRAALATMARRNEVPDVVHAHDWHAALAPMILRWDRTIPPEFGRARSVLTIHNLAYQGAYGDTALPFLGLPWEAKAFVAQGGGVNILKGGLIAADAITAVSPNYAWEITTPEGGFGLDGVMRSRVGDLHGIVNGIDTQVWDPARDPMLAAPFSASALGGKATNRAALLTRAGMDPREPGMVLGMIGRMVEQKGFDLLFPCLERLLDLGIRLILLGSGDAGLEGLARTAAAAHPGRVFAHIGFNEGFAHLIEAGSDAFLMPSRFEPCGLNQLYSLRYGTLPIVRRVGGLTDTVEGFDGENLDRATGFSFDAPTPAALEGCIRWALRCFADSSTWRAIQQNGMRQDYSWERSARRYLEVYGSVFGR